MGPDYCAPGKCVSECTAKSDCDAGWGAQWSAHEKCPLNVCCSKFGFCGTTKDFCGDVKVKSPSCAKDGGSVNKRVIGYYEGWSSTRACGGMMPEDLPFHQYTHLNFAFAFINPKTFEVAPMSAVDEAMYPRFTALKQLNPGMQTWISIGGWSMNDPDQPTATTFSDLAASPGAQSKFFKSLVNFMSTYGFDGIDMDWEYPVAPERSGKPADLANYVSFLKNLKNALGSGGHKYGLTITIPSSFWYMQNFDIVAISKVIDWFNVMSYDLHGTWDSTNPYIGPIVGAHTNLTEIDLTMDLLWRNNIDPDKIVLGVGFYGRSFTLTNPSCAGPGCGFSGGGKPGKCSASAGTLMFSEIQDVIKAGAKVTLDKAAAVQIVTYDTNQWVSYDDDVTFKLKVEYGNSKCLGGLMVWAASTDDSVGSAIQSLNKATGRAVSSLAVRANLPSSIGTCVWGECGKSCDSGLSPAAIGSGRGGSYAGIRSGCDSGVTRPYCCPNSNKPTCRWVGEAKFCGGPKCSSGEVEVATDNAGGGGEWHKILCCTDTGSTANAKACDWAGAAPFCSAKAALGPAFYYSSYGCSKPKPYEIATGKHGDGGESACWPNGGFKSYCCEKQDQWKKCQWHQARNSWTEWAHAFGQLAFGASLPIFLTDCTGGCPNGQITVAVDPTACRSGTYSHFCCDNPNADLVSPPSLPPGKPSSLCPAKSDPFYSPLSHDESGDPWAWQEAEYFDSNCFIGGVDDTDTDPALRRRDDVDFQGNELPGNSSIYYEEGHGISKRSAAARLGKQLLKVCVNPPGKGRLAGAVDLPPVYAHPHVNSLFQQGRLALIYTGGATGQLACSAASLVFASKDDAKIVEKVTEHVFEKQTYKDGVQAIGDGIASGGAKLPMGKFSVTELVRLASTPWKNLPMGSITPPVGTSFHDTCANFLGTAADIRNFQIFMKGPNTVKMLLTAGKNLAVTDKTGAWVMSPLDRLTRFKDTLAVFDYYRIDAVVKSFSSTNGLIQDSWSNFQVAVKPLYDYPFAAAQEFQVNENLKYQVVLGKKLFDTYIKDEIIYWGSKAAQDTYTAAVALANKQQLEAMAATYGTKIAIDIAKMLGAKNPPWQRKLARGEQETNSTMSTWRWSYTSQETAEETIEIARKVRDGEINVEFTKDMWVDRYGLGEHLEIRGGIADYSL
ncbi:glycoside hydrolase family 18 protein [Cucurbitaria berberidis CBS 394.84]|uniref:chitinase n=1 Tax=Cucurbitaria berberidis CBS 394.84 TaxID=1168544 RepID=A0A9P4LDA5_9PLEO|nr:glycoside hydrolase family 18 protein [Cucurbitaria berberidis CBS 394.84]KAF1849934.1 glycoside hydrolase family 18 protein [Cucurbitaria berberidis CBS 394.84]